jgi:hypothetical protein
VGKKRARARTFASDPAVDGFVTSDSDMMLAPNAPAAVLRCAPGGHCALPFFHIVGMVVLEGTGQWGQDNRTTSPQSRR